MVARWGARAPGVAYPPGRPPPAFWDGIAGLGHSQPCFSTLSVGAYWATQPGVGASAPAHHYHHRFTGVSLKHLFHSTFKFVFLKKKKKIYPSYLNSLKALTSSSPLLMPPPLKNLFKHSHRGGSVYKEAAEWCSLGNRSAAITECHMLFLPVFLQINFLLLHAGLHLLQKQTLTWTGCNFCQICRHCFATFWNSAKSMCQAFACTQETPVLSLRPPHPPPTLSVWNVQKLCSF